MENNEKEVLFSVSHLKKYFQVGNHATLKAVDDEKSSGLTATVIATDGIAVIVNKENPTDGLTSDQVKSIYVGDTTDWADVK